MSARSVARGVVAGLTLAACEADSTVWWEGQYVRYTASEGLHVCAGTPEYTDDFVPFVAGELGIPVPPRLEYHWLDGEAFDASICASQGTVGCALGARSLSLKPALLHELVHNVTSPSGMNRLPFVSEGLASAYDAVATGNAARYFPTDLTVPDPRLQMTLRAREIDYGRATRFIVFLLVRHGPEKLVAFAQRVELGDSLDAIEDQYRVAYGHELADEVEAYLRGADLGCDADHFDLLPYECTSPTVAWSDGRWVSAAVMDCEADDVVGGDGEHEVSRLRSVTVDVPEAGLYDVRIYGDEPASARLGRCFGCPWQHADVFFSSDMTAATRTTLEAGTHFVRVTTAVPGAPLIGVTITPVPAP